MTIRQIILVFLLAVMTGAGVMFTAQFVPGWMQIGLLSSCFVGLAGFVAIRQRVLVQELAFLREHLESTRQHAALLARHTRELRDGFAQTTHALGVASREAGGQIQASDFAVLSALVRDLADSVAEMERRSERVETELSEARRQRTTGTARTASVQPAVPNWVAASKSAMMMEAPPPSPAPPPMLADPVPALQDREPPRAIRQLVAAAIAADRFDLFLQPIVGLPQRKTRAYDVVLRPDGAPASISSADIRASVEAVGHQLVFDRQLLIQTVRLARMFERRERDVLLFVDISQRFLMSDAALEELDALLLDVPGAAQRIVLGLPQRFFRKAVAFEHQALRDLAAKGFRFMMRDMDSVDFDPVFLTQLNVKWLQMSAQNFLDMAQGADDLQDMVAADYTAQLARKGLNFIVSDVEDESAVVELLDLNVHYAQGQVFSPPRAVRADAMEAARTADANTARAAVSADEPRRGLRDIARRATL